MLPLAVTSPQIGGNMDKELVAEIERCFSKEDAFYIILEISLGASVDSAIQNVIGGKYDD